MKAILLLMGLLAGTASVVIGQKSEVFIKNKLAIGGYDPVAYFTEGKPAKGSEKFSYDYNGAKWHFRNQQNLEVFKADPLKYSPQYGGYCAYGLSNGYKAPTEPDAWTIADGKLYLNYNTDVRKMWNKQQKELIIKADTNWPTVKIKE